MARPLPPIPIETPDAAIIGPILVDMDARDLFADANAPGAWTLDLIQRRQRGGISRRQAATAQRYIFTALGLPDRWAHWAILNATDILPAVDLSTLTIACLNEMIRVAGTLWQGVFGKLWRTPAALATATLARKSSLAASCGPDGPAWAVFLDRAAAQLGPFLGL